MNTIKIVGIDMAFSNMGLAKATLDLNTMTFQLDDLILVSTEKDGSKAVRKSSDDLRRARLLFDGLQDACKDAAFVIAEIPTGSQSARASWALGIAVGVLASHPVPLIQVSPTEVKLATVGKKTATKEEMINYAMTRHPAAPWLMRKFKGQMVPIADNEHLADAVSCIYAGLKTEQFKQATALLRSFAA